MSQTRGTSCQACGAQNRPGRRFCGACGVALAIACPACGFSNEPDERFCGGCGVDVGAAAPAPGAPPTPPAPARAAAPAPAPASRSEAERRQLSVMFCDLVGSTALATRLDPEDLRDVIRSFQERCSTEVARWDGFIARYMGDGVLVYFGYPRAHEDDAERAVRAGLGLVEACADLVAQVRVGVATGGAVVGDLVGAGPAEERTVVGETPNLAARLQAVAEPGAVVISATTRRLVGERFELQDLGALALKGFAEPVGAFRVLSSRAVRSRFEARGATGALAMIGRDRELELLLDRWACARQGEGQAVLLAAEAGLGKSRLLFELERRIGGEPHHVVRLQGSAHHRSSPWRPVIEWLSQAVGFGPADAPGERYARLEALVPAARRPERLAPLADLLSLAPASGAPAGGADLPPERRKDAAIAAIVGQVEDLARERPTLLAFEDAQWMDPTTEELVGRLVDRCRTSRLMVLLTARPERDFRFRQHSHVTHLALTRLRAAECAALVSALADPTPLPASVVDTIVARSDGVPLYLEELCRAVVESGTITVPETLRESLMARLDRRPVAREVAQAAAVLGREFSRDVLAGTTGLEEGRLEAALRDLEDAGVVLDHGEGRHSFAHALVRDVAYESLLRRTRRSLHRAAARALEASAEIATGQPEVVAHHLAEAGEPAEAIAWFERAAELAERRHAYAEAVEHRGRALDALGPAEDDAAAAARRVRIEIDLALALRTIDRIDEAFAPLDRAERLAGRFDRADLLSRVHFVRGNLHFGSGRTEECLASHTRALEEARRAGDPEAEARAWGGLGDAGYSVGTMRSARDSFERCVTLARQHGFETIEADNLPMLAICSSYLLDSVRARELGAAAAALARRLNRPRAQLVASNSLAFECTARGELEEAMAMGRSSVELARRIGSRGFEVSARFFLTTVLAAAGRSDEARAVLKDAVIPEGSVLGTYFGIAAQTRQAAFDGDLEGLRRVFERMDLSRWHFGHVWACVDFMEAALDMRAFDEVDRMREALARCPPPEPIPWVDHYGRLCGALANVGRGRRDEETRRALEELRAAAAVREHHRDVARIDRALATW